MSFDVDALLERARVESSLEDFGDATFREGLERLVEALCRSPLTDVGRMAWQGQIGGYLVERLRIEDWYRRHPDIAAEEIRAPIVVTGLPRTGTTALSNLLAQDPEARSLRYWESQLPTPPPETETQHSDERIAIADARLAGMKSVAPDLAKMHDDTGTSPTENQDLLGQHFRTQHFEGMADVPGYMRWWLSCDMEPAYRRHARVLRLLQWRCGPKRWNLKNPPEMFFLDEMTDVYPDARIVWTHRDPAKILPSVCSLIATVRSIFSQPTDPKRLGREQLALWSEGMRRALDFRKRKGEGSFVDVFMDDLVRKPIDAIAQVYDGFGLPLSTAAEQRMRAWMDSNPQGKHGAHHYGLREFGLDLGEVRDAFGTYTERFDVRLED